MYSSDRFHKSVDQIYRVTTEVKTGHYDEFVLATSPAPLKNELLQYEDVESIVRIWNRFSDNAISEEKKMPVNGYFTDPEFLDIFSFNLEYGDIRNALTAANTIVLTKEWAEKYFGNENPVGKTIEFNELGQYTVTGMFERLQNKKSHMQFDLIASSNTLLLRSNIASPEPPEEKANPYGFVKRLSSWKDVYRTYTYIKFKQGSNISFIQDKFTSIINKHYDDPSTEFRYGLQPLLKISPGQNLSNSLGRVEDPNIAYILVSIAIIITLTASFTYTNLFVAKSLSRTKEVGIKKVIGARRFQLILQFIIEAVLLTLISLNIAYVLLIFIEPQFYIVDPNFKETFFIEEYNAWLYISTIIFTVFLGIIIGYLPSRYMSKLSPVNTLKNVFKSSLNSRLNIKKSIIVFQFSISLILIYGITIMYKQISFQQEVDPGFTPEGIIILDLKNNDFEKLNSELKKISSITNISGVSYLPYVGTRSMTWIRSQDQSDSIISSHLIASPEVLETLDIDLLAGGGFNAGELSGKEKYVVVSKTTLPMLGFEYANDALDKYVIDGEDEYLIVGVCDDIVLQSADRGPEGFIIRLSSVNHSHLLIKYNEDVKMEGLITSIGATWDKTDPVHEFTYDFYTNKIEEYYASPKSMLKIFGAIAFFAVLISFMGLFGIVLYTTESRIKEVGIRKVFGAEIKQVLWTISRRFLIMILGAILITTPLVWTVGEIILENFYYRITISIEHFLYGIFSMLSLGLLTVFALTIQAANKNPVETLRYE